jgi:hypothetical protein
MANIMLIENGFAQIKLVLPDEIKQNIRLQNWNNLDRILKIATSPDGFLHQQLQLYISIKSIEFIIAIRSAPDDEDGIWHDDGSRQLAFTLSLVEDLKQLEGGILQLRQKSAREHITLIPTPAYGTLTIIKTGHEGYEHCVTKVSRGTRIICAGWIN